MCDYCKKVNNKLLIGCSDRDSGVDAQIHYWKKEKRAVLSVSGFYDGFVGIEGGEIEIKYCPMCGIKL
jgi:hypothetical protein